MNAILLTLYYALEIYKWIVIAMIIVSWLVAFDIINRRNRFVDIVWDFLIRVTEPALAPIRRFMPNLGGIDISPIILFIVIFFLQTLILNMARGVYL
ncbi:YggT family protein [Notoacmeibacter sp. MSK16QG-6]|uniref:YggT family protein n=1 Tax=Notoacmeibacter sp. MSK16QG-6 TaxID=2957982 RepID=UPI00209FD91A|nr:YggT family protein [Notoacmeibacter sp. MSK16QG-6]MCP1199227.1 YggT family protein [Notoacmeibacter sp. MSK16QG-6]